jgi:hypothetical protein
MRLIRSALRLSVPQFAKLLCVGDMALTAREHSRSRWPGNPVAEHRTHIEAELARMERDIAAVRALLAEATPPASAPAPSLSPVSATAHPTEAATA